MASPAGLHNPACQDMLNCCLQHAPDLRSLQAQAAVSTLFAEQAAQELADRQFCLHSLGHCQDVCSRDSMEALWSALDAGQDQRSQALGLGCLTGLVTREAAGPSAHMASIASFSCRVPCPTQVLLLLLTWP